MYENKNLPEIYTEKKSSGFVSNLKRILEMSCRNHITVSGNREFFSIPIIAFIAVLFFGWKIAMPAAIISLFCGVEYTVSGEDIPEQKKLSFRPKA